MAHISIYDPAMLIWIDETGCDRRNTVRKFGYSIRGMPICDKRILARRVRYSAIPIMSLSGIHDVYITEGTVNGDEYADFIEHCLLPILQPFNNVNPLSVVVMDNASIHHVEGIRRLIEDRAGAKLIYLPPYSPDLMPAEGVFSQVKSILKENHNLFQICTAPRVLLTTVFAMVSAAD